LQESKTAGMQESVTPAIQLSGSPDGWTDKRNERMTASLLDKIPE